MQRDSLKDETMWHYSHAWNPDFIWDYFRYTLYLGEFIYPQDLYETLLKKKLAGIVPFTYR